MHLQTIQPLHSDPPDPFFFGFFLPRSGGHRLEHGIRDLVRRELSAEIGRDESLADDRVDGLVDVRRGFGEAHELEHEGRGPDRRDRVRDGREDVGDVGGGTVDGLT